MLTRRLCRVSLLVLPVTLLAGAEPAKKKDGTLRLNLRTRVEPFKGSGAWEEVVLRKLLPGKETAVILCDVWDRHWCESASRRCAALAKKMVPVLKSLRAKGVTVIHAPSECMEFYRDYPQRKRVLALPRVSPPRPLVLPDPPLPVDDSDGGCDDEKPAKFSKTWTRQHPAIPIEAGDFISDDGREVYGLLRRRGIKNLLVMGVHTNMCVLNRSFAIKQMTRWGVRCVLVRDLTDAMYNPKRPPHVSHEKGTELVVEHVEKHWCPTVLSADLLK